MVSDSDDIKVWAQTFFREPWKAIPLASGGEWGCTLEDESKIPEGTQGIIARCQHEEAAKHLVRAHDLYTKLLQGVQQAELENGVRLADDIDIDSQPPPDRTPVV